jgi:hypothetical protein
VRLVHDDIAQRMQQAAKLPVAGQHADVQHVWVRDQQLRARADASTLCLGRVSVVDVDRGGSVSQCGASQLAQRAQLVLWACKGGAQGGSSQGGGLEQAAAGAG